jgi:hypothetical protein
MVAERRQAHEILVQWQVELQAREQRGLSEKIQEDGKSLTPPHARCMSV